MNTGWKFALAGDIKTAVKIPDTIIPGKWFDAEVPGTIHTDLLNLKLIDDPYYSDNELSLGWISENDWIYKTEFEFNPVNKKNYELALGGIDTVADVYLNGSKIYSCFNMFVEYKITIDKYLKQGKNELSIYFHSPVKFAESEEKRYGKIPVELNSYRVFIRKAQYSFGWDWGPSFPTSGIRKNIYLREVLEAEIESIRFDTLKITKSKASVKVTAGIKSGSKAVNKLHVKIGGIEKVISVRDERSYEIEFLLKDPQLWRPNGEGNRFLYDLELWLLNSDGKELDHKIKRVGIRIIELIRNAKKDNCFKFRVNGRDIFAKGVNWIPADSFLNRVTPDKYSKLLEYAESANMNIVRVWGGGIYESDYFYELCDELGLLVWQDFMFACGSYPEHKEFVDNVKKEVEQNVKKLQHHPSIALWCGNNENEWIWYQKQSTPYKKMPGYKIYHDVIPSLLKVYDPLRPYHASSPFGDDEDPNSFKSGNTHQWEIWSKWIDYTDVENDRSLFVSEFGFQGPANKDTFEKVIPRKNRKVYDRIFEFHNKQIEGPERIWRFLSAHLPLTTNWNDFFYLAQLNQGFALETCLEHWQTNGRTNGSIIWQINDSWPVTSWAIIDYDLKPKLAYHFVKNVFSPQLIYFSEEDVIIKVKLQNQSTDEFKGTYRLAVIDTSSGKIIDEQKSKVKTKAGKDDTIDEFKKSYFLNSNKIIITNLYNSSGELINTNYYHHKPWKYYQLAEANISLNQIEEKNKTQLLMSTDKPAYFVDLYLAGVEFSKRGFTLLPNEEVVIDLLNNSKQINLNHIKTFSLNDFLR